VTPSVSADAERELVEAALFYAGKANAELGLALVAEFERALNLLCERPRLGAVWRVSTRRFALRRFPFSIIYQLKDDQVRVIALAHQRRRPGYWRGRE